MFHCVDIRPENRDVKKYSKYGNYASKFIVVDQFTLLKNVQKRKKNFSLKSVFFNPDSSNV